ncbi:MAG: ABC transporter substrate-binding protein [Syntrophobacteraceae bacterium]
MRKLSLHSAGLRISAVAFLWLLLVTWSHMVLNKECSFRNRVIMGYMPVVSNLAAPLVDCATKGDDPYFEALKFSSFSEMGEAFRSGHIQAAFIIAPLALMLFDQGVPLKVVYIGNRHESTMVVRASARYDSASDLIGKTIAIPLRYSGHYLALKRYLREHGLTPSDVRIIEIPPPEMPVALAASEIDGYFVGEPFASKALQTGIGKRFLDVESIWPKFICNVLIVRRELIQAHPEWVQKLVETAIMSGFWAQDHVDEAIGILSSYWGQEPQLIQYAFSNPPNRFRFDLYTPKAEELDEILLAMRQEGLVTGKQDFKAMVEDRFAVAGGEYNKASQDLFSRLERATGFHTQAAKQ